MEMTDFRWFIDKGYYELKKAMQKTVIDVINMPYASVTKLDLRIFEKYC